MRYASVPRPGQDGRAGKANKQTVFDDARDQAEQAWQTRRIGNAPEMGIDNPVAAIGDKDVAIFGLSDLHLPGNAALPTCLGDGALRRRQAEWNHRHR